ncbi:hypothetical protein [Pseudomonas chlororaphis]|uniref:hypothetical protein n=1 Tax=Pseudomonas chlororaphis TaxID=587753 RepID=UPI0012DA8E54|nr:hypothetical protein [Pseudomonas chlororaphis]
MSKIKTTGCAFAGGCSTDKYPTALCPVLPSSSTFESANHHDVAAPSCALFSIRAWTSDERGVCERAFKYGPFFWRPQTGVSLSLWMFFDAAFYTKGSSHVH